MGFSATGVAALVGAVSAAAGATASIISGNAARSNARHAADLQQQAQEQQKANDASKAAEERRQQFREQRVKQARIEQASINTGTDQSSGQLGAVSGSATQLSSNVGFNLGQLQGANRIGELNQGAADSMFDARRDLDNGAEISSIFNTVGSVAGTYGKVSAKNKVTSGVYDASFDNPNDYG